MEDLSSGLGDRCRYVIGQTVNDCEDGNTDDRDSLRREFRERRNRIEPFLRRLRSTLDIDADTADLSVSPVPRFADLFPETDILAVHGPGFERPTLPPVSSYMYCALRRLDPNVPFVELTPSKSGLNELLDANWDVLPSLQSDRLADFILTMHTVETTDHEVLRGIADLDTASRSDEGFALNEAAQRLLSDRLLTSMVSKRNQLTIQALTLYGWMHEKQNLGFTDIEIRRGGELSFGDRETLCEPVFDTMPRIWY